MSFSSLLSLLLLCSATLVLAQQKGQTSSHFPLSQVLVGEEALLNIQTFNEELSGNLVASEESALEFRALPRDILGSQTVATNIGVSSSLPGVIKVPSFSVPLESGEKTSNAFELEAFPQDVLEWRTLNIDSKIYQVGIALLHPSGTIYAGQSIPLTAKILLPTELPIRSIGIAELEKDNIGAWRMEAPLPPNYNQRVSPRNPNALQPRQIQIGNKSYQVINYTTFASPLKDGPVTLGPGKTQGLQVQVTSSQRSRGFFSSFSSSVNLDLELPQISFTAAPLPANAPADFQGAIGDFTLESSVDITKEHQPGDPVLVELTVSGQGNLDTLAAPSISGPESNWKMYPTSRNDTGNERRSNQGSVSFTQILRPLVPIKAVPPFTLSFFNPKTKSYQTLRSEPIPLNLSPLLNTATNEPPEAGLIPVAEMQDILSVIQPQAFSPSKSFSLRFWWQVIPALLAGALLFLLIKRHLPKLPSKDKQKDEISSQFRELEKEKDPAQFLRTATRLAEGNELITDDFLKQLQTERDQTCFVPDSKTTELASSRRSEIIKGLRERLSLIILLFSLTSLLPNSAEAFSDQALKAWENEDYQNALEAYELALKDENEKKPDLLYNIGNCYYRLGEPGKAGLYYARALKLAPQHPEALQNRKFLERKIGTFSGETADEVQKALNLSRSRILSSHLLLLMMWIFILALLARILWPTHAVKGWSLGLLIGSFCASLLFGYLYLSATLADDTPFEADAIFVNKDTTEVRSEPSAGGSTILDATPATTCRILAQRGQWTYIELPDESRGWVEESNLDHI